MVRADLVTRRAQGRANGSPQDRVGSDLEEDAMAVGRRGFARGLQTHGSARVGPPVVGIVRGAVDPTSERRRVQRHAGGPWVQAGERGEEFVAHGVHRGAVVGNLHPNSFGEHASGAKQLLGRGEGFKGAGQRDHFGRVEGRDDDTGEVDQLGLDPVGAQADGEHPALASGALLQAAAVMRREDGIFEAERARGPGRGDFTHRVTQDGVGLETPVAQHGDESDLNEQVGRLRNIVARHAGALAALEHLGEDGAARDADEVCVGLVQGGLEDGVVQVEFSAHLPPLRPHAREHPYLAATDAIVGLDGGRDVALCEREQAVAQLLVSLRENAGTHGEVTALVDQARAQVGQRGSVSHEGQRLGRRDAQVLVGMGRNREEGGTVEFEGRGRCELGRLFDDHVGVGATVAKTIDGSPGRTGGRPRFGGLRNADAKLLEVDGRVELANRPMGEHRARLHAQRRLDQARNAGPSFQVPEVGLDRADGQGCFALPAVNRGQGATLERVTHCGSGAVGFDVGDARWIDLRALADAGRKSGLGSGVGDGNARGRTILVDAAAANDGADGVAIGEGPVEGLEQDDAGTLTATVAIGVGLEGFRATVGGQEMSLAHHDLVVGQQHQVHAAGHGQFTFTTTQGLAGEVDGDERGAAGRVYGHAGAL